MSELPQGWALLKVTDVFNAVGSSHKKIKTKNALTTGRFPVIDQGAQSISGYSNDKDLVVPASEKAPVILFGDHTRILKFIERDFVPGADGTKLLQAGPMLEDRFAFQALSSIKLPDKGYARHYQYLRNAEIRVPPFPEQKRIADKLDAVLARVDSARARLDKIPALLKRFRQSVLAAATSGALTEEWRDGEEVGAKWKETTIGEICTVVRGASPRPAGDPRYFGGDCPWITVSELTKDENKFLHSTSNYVTEEGRNRSRYIEPGTLLLSNSGATLGVPKITLIGGCINDGSVALLDLEEPRKTFLYWKLKGITDTLRSLNQGAAQPNLNTSIVKAIEVALPPLEEQHEIIRRVESLFAIADRIQKQYEAAKAKIDKLAPALLAKAFRGELVPQDPNDEPASVMLARLRAEKSNTIKKSRNSQTS